MTEPDLLTIQRMVDRPSHSSGRSHSIRIVPPSAEIKTRGLSKLARNCSPANRFSTGNSSSLSGDSCIRNPARSAQNRSGISIFLPSHSNSNFLITAHPGQNRSGSFLPSMVYPVTTPSGSLISLRRSSSGFSNSTRSTASPSSAFATQLNDSLTSFHQSAESAA